MDLAARKFVGSYAAEEIWIAPVKSEISYAALSTIMHGPDQVVEADETYVGGK